MRQHGRFADVTNDVAFRKIFGNENKTEILISFLNAVLKLKDDQRITEVAITNPYQFPRVVGEKASIIDVRAKDLRGRQFVVEMQMTSQRGFAKRVQYYTCRDYSMQIDSGEKYHLLHPTFFIGILNFNFFKGEDYLCNHLIIDQVTHEHKLDDIKFTFIELLKFDLKADQLKTPIEKWVFFLKEIKDLDDIPDNTDDKGLLQAYKDAEIHSWDKEEYISYDNAFMRERDAIARVEFAVEKAVEEGVEKALSEEKIETAERALTEGATVEFTAKITGLTIEQVKEIQQNMNTN